MHWTRRALRQENGFTLIESLLQVVIWLLCSSICVLIVVHIYNAKSSVNGSLQQVAWEVLVNDLQQVFDGNNVIEQVTESKVVGNLPSGDSFEVLQNKQVLLLRKNNGYEVIYYPIKNVHFRLQEQNLFMSILFEDGEERERMFVVGQAEM